MALLEREVLDGNEVNQLIEGKTLAAVQPPPSGDGTQQVIKPEPGRRLPGPHARRRPAAGVTDNDSGVSCLPVRRRRDADGLGRATSAGPFRQFWWRAAA